jgi:hypothetical protein
MIASLIGIFFIGLGLWGLIHWFREFLILICGLLPVSLLVGGVVAVVSGISSSRTRRRGDHEK